MKSETLNSTEGVLSLRISGDTFLLENLCAIRLHKIYNKDEDVPGLYYYNRNIEVDFFVPDEALAVQAAYSIQNEETRKREVNSLIELNKLQSLKKAYIITYDEEEQIECENLVIDVIPIWKWLLS